jgi:hypothetical protein
LLRHFSPALKGLTLASGAVLTLAGTLALSTASFADDAPAAAPAATPAPAPAAPAPAPAAAPAAPAAPTGIQTSGLLVGYYQYQFHNPKDNPLLPLRAFDVRHNTPTLNLAELNVWKAAPAGGFGWKTTLATGDTVDALHGGIGVGYVDNEPRLKNIVQLYGTLAFKNGGGIDFGKFYTPFGYEVTEENGNNNFSNSLPFDLLPFYHAGARITLPTMKGLTLTGYIVNAIYNTVKAGVHDDNGQAAFAGQLNYTDPKGKYVFIENFGGGKDKFNLASGLSSVNNKVTLSDTDFTWNLNAASLIGLNYVYAKTDPEGSSTGKVTANGYAAYYKDQFTPKHAIALRLSGFNASATGGGKSAKPWEITGTYEIKTAANFTTRLEYRHDAINKDNGAGILFPDKDAMFTESNQDTFTIGGMYTFQ